MGKTIKLKQKVYIPSISEYDAACEKYLAFMGARLSEKAKQDGVWEDSEYGAGYFFLRSAFASSSYEVYSGDANAARGGWDASDCDYAGLRVAFNLIYNPESDLVKGCRMKTRKTLVLNLKREENEIVKSTAPIVKFGDKECIWLNKEECESGQDKVMKLWTLDLVEKAVPFDRNGEHNDYAKAKALRAQCESIFTQQELDQMVEVEMSSEDGYETVTAILKNENNSTVKTEEESE